jgi:hypothetical protein
MKSRAQEPKPLAIIHSLSDGQRAFARTLIPQASMAFFYRLRRAAAEGVFFFHHSDNVFYFQGH